MEDNCKKGHELVDGQECIQCVRCEVTNCKYNDENRRCTAKDIRIGPTFASCCSDTVCDTFKAR